MSSPTNNSIFTGIKNITKTRQSTIDKQWNQTCDWDLDIKMKTERT